MPRFFVIITFLLVMMFFPSSSSGQTRGETQDEALAHEETVEVVAVTPMHGIGIDRHRHTSNVQSSLLRRRDTAASTPLTSALRRELSGVDVSDVQSNPFQADLLFRGFTISPLLGSPQGVAVFLDGVRVNDTFGDTINWSLLPTEAIESVQVFPGSNPMFGLNSLGGALSFQTQSGLSSPTSTASVEAGSERQRSVEVTSSTRADDGRRGLFLSLSGHDEPGWRDHSPSTLATLFARGSAVSDETSRDMSILLARSDLVGNGLTPVELLARDRAAVFTHPDATETRAGSLTASQRRSHVGWLLEGVSYARVSRTDTLNGDDTPFEECDDRSGVLCIEDSDEVVFDQFGQPVTWTGTPLDAVDNRTATRQMAVGVSVQAGRGVTVYEWPADLVLGGSFDGGDVDFSSSVELARLTPSRGTAGTGIFSLDDYVELRARTWSGALFGFVSLEATERIGLNLALRATHTAVDLNDQLGESLNGSHRFTRLNPAMGMTYRIAPNFSWFAGVSQSSRAPTPVELTCADPEDPCRLPNAFVADPPLADVVTGSFETGIRRDVLDGSFAASVYVSRSDDDIIFVSSGALTSEGHFENVGSTGREGLELSVDRRIGRVSAWIRYSLTDARYGTSFFVSSPEHPMGDGSRIFVEKGDRLPGVPRHAGSLGAQWLVRQSVSLNADLAFSSSRHMRGDESNQLAPVPGFQRLDVAGAFRVGRHWALTLTVRNVLDARYETFGILGDATDVLGDDFGDPRFLSPGAPRSYHLRLSWR